MDLTRTCLIGMAMLSFIQILIFISLIILSKHLYILEERFDRILLWLNKKGIEIVYEKDQNKKTD